MTFSVCNSNSIESLENVAPCYSETSTARRIDQFLKRLATRCNNGTRVLLDVIGGSHDRRRHRSDQSTDVSSVSGLVTLISG